MIRFNLASPVTELSHIARSVTAQLKHLGVLTVRDLIFYFPVRYDDLSNVISIKDTRAGERAIVRARIELLQHQRSRYRRKLLIQAIAADATGSIRIVWFNQPWIAKILKVGDEVYLVGEIKNERGNLFLSSPVYEKISRRAPTHTARIVPVYPSTEKLSQKQIRFLVKIALSLTGTIFDPLPKEVQKQYDLAPLAQALAAIHFPSNEIQLEKARRRLKFDELFYFRLFAAHLKRELKNIPAPAVHFHEEITKRFVGSLPFQLTDDQRKAAWEILGNLTGRHHGTWNIEHGTKNIVQPMNRLLEGDVGSGKTVVAAIAALNCVLGDHNSPRFNQNVGRGFIPRRGGALIAPEQRRGTSPRPTVRGRQDLALQLGEGEGRGQVAIMVPTEILARQHFATFSKMLNPYGITVGLRTSVTKRRASSLSDDVVIGTHALIQKGVQFKNLVLAVVDEQHRFGVAQRAALKEKRGDGKMPHLLTLTATPIPRSLALVFYGDLDISILRQMPKGRQKIETVLVVDGHNPPQPNQNVGRGFIPRRGGALIAPEQRRGTSPRPTVLTLRGGAPNNPPLKVRGGEGGVMSRADANDFVRCEAAKGHQIFWTCPIIDPSDILGVKAATEVYEHLRNEVFPDLRVGLLHGRMKPKERERVMEAFAGISGGLASGAEARPRRIDILVATPVIEVGIDVPNATVMVIEGAQRFGLAQLHQLRGRVGRGEAQSHCLLIVDDIDGGKASGAPEALPPYVARLQAFLESDDGFALAERDLEIRGPGDVYGMAQSGFPEFKIASFADLDLAKQAKAAVDGIFKHNPELNNYPQLKAVLAEKQGKTHLE